MRVLSSILVFLAWLPAVSAQQAPTELDAIGHAAEILRQQSSSHPLLKELADQALTIAREQLPKSQALALPKKGQLLLFVSASMGDEGLKRAFQGASGHPDITIVFRGALPGEKFTEVTRRLGELLKDIDPRPKVAIHPKSFREHGVLLVPTIVEPATGKTIQGTFLAKTFLERASETEETDLGTVGPVNNIIEPDLVALIKERVAEIDVEQRARQSVRSYWQRAPFIDIQKATKPRVRLVDPTVTTKNDLRDHEGRLLAPAGTKINPLTALPFTARLLVFDGTDPRELQWAKDHILEDRKTILITTRISREVGWPAWKQMHQALGRPVNLLQAKIAERFFIERTPSLIEAAPDGVNLLIEEDVPAPVENPS